MDFLNILRKKPKNSIIYTNVKDIVKSFSNFIKDNIEPYYKDKSTLMIMIQRNSKDMTSAPDIHVLKQKINEYIKSNFKEKGYKADSKSFFLLLAEEYYKLVSSILNSSQNMSNPKMPMTKNNVLCFLKNFYEFEDELYISNSEVLDTIQKNQESYLLVLLKCLSYVKLCDSVEYILDKDNNIPDIGVKTVLIMYDFYNISNYLHTYIDSSSNKEMKDENTNNLDNSNLNKMALENKIFIDSVNKAICLIIPYFVDLFLKIIINDPMMKTVFLLMETGDLSKIFNELSNMRLVRVTLFDIFVKVNTHTKDGIKIRSFRKYVCDFSLLEGMFYSIQNSYFKKDFEDVYRDIFKDALNLIIIITGFYDEQKELKIEILNFLADIFKDLILTADYDSYCDICSKLVKEVFYLCFLDREDIKNKIYDKNLKYLESNMILVNNYSVYKDVTVIDFLLDLFEIEIKVGDGIFPFAVFHLPLF